MSRAAASTTVWADDGKPKKTFEWQKHSLFLLPHNHHHQFTNMQGDRPARLLHYNYLPLAMSAVQDPDFFFNNPYIAADGIDGQARRVLLRGQGRARRAEL